MSCKICGRGSCTESFHTLEQQQEHEERTACEENRECYDCQLAGKEINKLSAEVDRLTEILSDMGYSELT